MRNSTCDNTNENYFTDGHSHGFSPTAWDRLNAALLIVRHQMPHLTHEESVARVIANWRDTPHNTVEALSR
jgi:hypothetical protein